MKENKLVLKSLFVSISSSEDENGQYPRVIFPGPSFLSLQF